MIPSHIVAQTFTLILAFSEPAGLLLIGDKAALSQLSYGSTGFVASVIDGYTLTLSDNRHVRLIGIIPPELPLDYPHFVAWPYAEQAQNFLARLIVNQEIELYHAGELYNRYGYVRAYVRRRKDKLWIQDALLNLGLVRVSGLIDHPDLAKSMYSLEKEARLAKRGLWQSEFYALRTPENIAERIGHFDIVEGKISKTGLYKKNIYLDFTKNWRDGLSVSIDPAVQKLFLKAGIDPLSLVGQHVRVRGWIREKNGPRIELTHPAQLERD